MNKLLTIALCGMLAGCGGKTIVKDVPVRVSVPVVQPCAGIRPEVVSTLRDRYSDDQWRAMDVRQKAAAVSQVALELRTYGEQLNAATGACE